MAADPLRQYEERAAALAGAGHALAFANGRTALAAILRAAGLSAGDEVLLSPLTCKVVPLTLLSLGLIPRYADIAAATLNLDASGLGTLAGPRTRAVLFQHTYGSPAGLGSVADWADAHGQLLIEDRAQCLPLRHAGASQRRGRALIFSNNLMKPLPAGSGGLAVTDDETMAKDIATIRNTYALPALGADLRLRLSALVHDLLLTPRSYWPMLSLFERIDAGYRVRPLAEEIDTDVRQEAHQASAYQLRRGLASLDRLDSCAIDRRRHTADYAHAVATIPGLDVPAIDASLPLYYFPVLLRNKPALLARARRQFVEIVAWPRSTPIYPIDDVARLAQYGYTAGTCPVAESVAARLVGLPTDTHVTSSEQLRVLALLRDAQTYGVP